MRERRRDGRGAVGFKSYRPLAWAVFALTAPGACTGQLGEGRPDESEAASPGSGGARPGSNGSRPGSSGPNTPAESLPGAPAASAGSLPYRLTRLTREQYSNTVRDLLGDDSRPGEDLPVDLAGDSGFYQPGAAGALEARRFMDLADRGAARAVKELAKLLGCDPSDACVTGFIPKFLRRAYRRPPLPDELAAAQEFYKSLRDLHAGDVPSALRAWLSTLLQSPGFLYRWELGPQAARPDRQGVIALNPHELASRLSYFLWDSMPDDALFAAADAGALSNPAELAKQAQRMIASPKARGAQVSFFRQWLHTDRVLSAEKDPNVYKGFDDSVRAAMDAETRAFIEHVMFEGDGRIDTLLSSNESFVNGALAKIYGLTNVTGTEMQRQTLNTGERFGIVTQGSFLAAHAYPYDSAPVKRGLMVRERLLCQAVPAPPPDVVVEAPPPNAKVSVREQFAQHSKDPACRGCHQLIDPLGFAFEHYDGIGRYRTTSGGSPVDASGTLTGMAGGDRPFTDLRELMGIVRGSPEHKRCVSSQWLRYALGRKNDDGDAASLDAAHGAFERANMDVRALLVALVQTPSFRFRTPAAGEVMP